MWPKLTIVNFCLSFLSGALATATPSSCAGNANYSQDCTVPSDLLQENVLVQENFIGNALLQLRPSMDKTFLGDNEEAASLDADLHDIVEDLDCADEVILRLAISDSFVGTSYEQCVEELHAKTFQPGGSGADLMDAPDRGGSGLSHEEVVDRIQARCVTKMGHGIALGPRLVRMTFHDAADFENLAFVNGSEATGMGKVDSCLHTALLSTGLTQADDDDDLEDVAEGDPNHNRGLQNAEKWVMKMAAEGMISRPDVQVLGAIVALEAWMDGPEMGAFFGRTRGACSKIICTSESCWNHDTPFFKQPVAEPVGGGMFCPMTNTLEPLRKVLGLTLEELVALQGAHSVGGVIVCSGLGNVAKGPYCPKKCGIPPGDFFENGNLDGTSFDDTPGKLDNRYYQLLMDENFEDLPTCKDVSKVFPILSKRGLSNAGNASVGSAGGSGAMKDLTESCQAGVRYEPEDACEMEACVENCTLTPECVEAENVDDDDHELFKIAWGQCNECKQMCGFQHRADLAKTKTRSYKTDCRANCDVSNACTSTTDYNNGACMEDCTDRYDQCLQEHDVVGFMLGPCNSACQDSFNECKSPCMQQRGSERRACLQVCKDTRTSCRSLCTAKQEQVVDCRDNVRNVCRDECQSTNLLKRQCAICKSNCTQEAAELSNQIVGESEAALRPAHWCKRLTEEKKCLDADFKLDINGGWGGCPEDKRVTFPNLGQGRLTIIQNLERWTTFRGLNKRVMVLPSDWSYLGQPETKELFVQYGNDEALWHTTFARAWTKISKLGWGGGLKSCTPVTCAVSDGIATCSVRPVGVGNPTKQQVKRRMDNTRNASGLPPFVRPDTLDFELAKCHPPYTGSSLSCELIGGFGIKAKVQCDSWVGYCTTSQIETAQNIIDEEWKDGGKTPMCTPDAGGD